MGGCLWLQSCSHALIKARTILQAEDGGHMESETAAASNVHWPWEKLSVFVVEEPQSPHCSRLISQAGGYNFCSPQGNPGSKSPNGLCLLSIERVDAIDQQSVWPKATWFFLLYSLIPSSAGQRCPGVREPGGCIRYWSGCTTRQPVSVLSFNR